MSVKLTQLSHGGGCGCKISPEILQSLLSDCQKKMPQFPQLLVGLETSDDAAVFQISDDCALIFTTDFFMPIVDDAFDFGRVAATNAMSDVYAMGGKPVLALSILGMPVATLPKEVIQNIILGGQAACHDAGIPLAGGHSIDSPEPIFGCAVAGIVNPKNVKRNTGAQPGDVLILTKPIGLGVLTTAIKKDSISEEGKAAAIQAMTKLNDVGFHLGSMSAVHAMTDVTGFGLLGHLLNICKGSNVTATVRCKEVPFFDEALKLLKIGVMPGALERNWVSYEKNVAVNEGVSLQTRQLLCDPQTSGGLLLSVDPSKVSDVTKVLRDNNVLVEAIVGEISKLKNHSIILT